MWLDPVASMAFACRPARSRTAGSPGWRDQTHALAWIGAGGVAPARAAAPGSRSSCSSRGGSWPVDSSPNRCANRSAGETVPRPARYRSEGAAGSGRAERGVRPQCWRAPGQGGRSHGCSASPFTGRALHPVPPAVGNMYRSSRLYDCSTSRSTAAAVLRSPIVRAQLSVLRHVRAGGPSGGWVAGRRGLRKP